MPGVGKTYLGKKLAKELGFKWVDLDTASYSKIIKSGGEEFDYLKNEERVLLDAKGTSTVFSCGGSYVYSKKGMEHLKKISTIVCLSLSLEHIKKRLGGCSTRGIVGANKVSIDNLYKVREPLYEKYANYTVSCTEDSISRQYDLLKQFVQTKIIAYTI